MSLNLFGAPSTVDTGRRNDFDYYETAQWQTRSLLHWYPMRTPGRETVFYEPCVGGGAIARELHRAYPDAVVFTNDIDVRHEAAQHIDARTPEAWAEFPRIDYTVTNLPFNVAFEVLVQAYHSTQIAVCLLLRKTFLEPTRERGAWLAKHPPTRTICLPRHSFRGDGSDSVSCDWFIWEKGEPSTGARIIIDHEARLR